VQAGQRDRKTRLVRDGKSSEAFHSQRKTGVTEKLAMAHFRYRLKIISCIGIRSDPEKSYRFSAGPANDPGQGKLVERTLECKPKAERSISRRRSPICISGITHNGRHSHLRTCNPADIDARAGSRTGIWFLKGERTKREVPLWEEHG
jgi:hypothetical protein